MAHSSETRATLRDAYVRKGLSMELAAKQVDVSLATARRWRREMEVDGDDWDRARDAWLISDSSAKDIAVSTLQQIMEEASKILREAREKDLPAREKADILASVVDSMSKIKRVMERVMPETARLGVVMEVLEGLLEFTREKFPQHTQTIIELLEPFGVWMANRKGGHG